MTSKTPTLRLVKQSVLAAMCALSVGAVSTSAWADPSPALDRASISVGGFYVDPTFKLGVNTPYGRTDSGDINRDRTTLGRVRAEVLLFDHQGLSFDYYRYDNDFSAAIARTATVGGATVTGDASATANVKIDLAKLAYKWWIGSGRSVFGVGLGAAYYRANVNYVASGSLNGVTGSASGSSEADAVAPLLEVGWRMAVTDNVRLYAEASGIKKNGGNLNGHIYNGAVGVEWFPFKNIGIQADYGISKIYLHRDVASNDADLSVRLVGPSVYLKARF
jgi:hypothetical protein